ncbi:MAG: hypothetical protein C0624_02325 [Desulfuromonas sp.]|nr:MAG: hypothetical protein C0624_02325 [Desulfuromonas sp.]
MKGKTSVLAMGLLLGSFSTSMAATAKNPEEMGFLTLLFIGFFALIVVMQLIPGIGLLVSMLSGLFSAGKTKSEEATAHQLGKK